MKQFAVIGLGYFGTSVARTLREQGHEVLVIDESMTKVQHMIDEQLATEGLCLDATNLYALRQLGLASFDAVVLAIGENLQDSILTAMNLQELGVSRIVAKSSTPAHGKILEKLNVDTVINPERQMGERVAQSLLHAHVLEGFALDPRYAVTELRVPEGLIGHSLQQLDLRGRYGIQVLVLKHVSQALAIVPTPEVRLQAGDRLLVLGEQTEIQRLLQEGS